MPDLSPDTNKGPGRRETFDDLVRCAAQAGLIVLEKNNRSALLLDRYAQRGIFVGGEEQDSGMPNAEQMPAMFDEMVSQANQQEDKEGGLDFHVHVVCGRPRPPEIVEALGALVQIPSIDRLTVTLHVAPGSQWWRWALSVFRPLARASVSETARSMVFRVQGTVDVPPESEGNEIIRAGIGLQYVWADAHLGSRREINEQREAITTLARFGFRVPVVFYVHAGNAEHIPDWVQRVLEWNLQSGFALYPGESHPVSRAAGAFKPLVTESFIDLASSLYSDHQFYDDVFDPPASVWDRMRRAVRLPVPLLIDEEGIVRHFHKLPILGRDLCDVSHFGRRGPDILKALSETYDGLSVGVDAGCRDCQWRYVCRGVDETHNGDPSHHRFQNRACKIWLFWFMALTWERYEVQQSAVDTDLGDAPTTSTLE